VTTIGVLEVKPGMTVSRSYPPGSGEVLTVEVEPNGGWVWLELHTDKDGPGQSQFWIFDPESRVVLLCGADALPNRAHCYDCHYDLDHMCRETPKTDAGSVSATGPGREVSFYIDSEDVRQVPMRQVDEARDVW
jgi:hypothetical protein